MSPSTRLIALLCLVLGSGAAAQPGQPSRIEGKWLTDDGTAVVVVDHCGREICGAIATVLNKGKDVPTTDVENPDQRLRSRPIVGLTILSGFRPDGATWRGGRAYDPKTGRSYRSTLALDGARRLVVTGCILFICRSMTWQRLSSEAMK
jgi:uncharacterized protein (DUF2147 family)